MTTATSIAPPPGRSAAPQTPRIPWPVAAALFAAGCVLTGVLWDISWHRSIGRDAFFSPPHIAIYLGGIVAGVACGWLALRTTFAGSPAERAAGVSFWRWFRAPLGAWICIWGAFAMITSAPFDDWWHNAYGLDVEILSPPHVVLAAGVGAICFGALVMTLSVQNRMGAAAGRRVRLLVALAFGMLVAMLGIMVMERTWFILAHGAGYYKAAAWVFPALLVAAGRAGFLRWSATAAAAVYMALMLVTAWALQLLPAEPRLAPVYVRITHMVPQPWPLLLVVAALGIDATLHRFGAGRSSGWRAWPLAAALGGVFFALFAPLQWAFTWFQLKSPLADNWFFMARHYPYMMPPDSYWVRGEFVPLEASASSFTTGLLAALVLSMLTARVGLMLGGWLRQVKR